MVAAAKISLFRGDSVPQSVRTTERARRPETFARYFVGCGLMAKAADGGNPNVFKRCLHLSELIVAHVGYETGSAEQAFAKKSWFMSFTEESALAFAFADRTLKKSLQPCPLEDASHFVWRLDAPLDIPGIHGRGCYGLRFRADPMNVLPHVNQQLNRAWSEAANGSIYPLIPAIANQIAVENALADSSVHHAVLFNVVTFVEDALRSGVSLDKTLVRNTLNRAARDREWLLLPADPFPDGGPSCRIPMNEYLSVHEALRVA